jgi:hypothetical protein
VIVRDSDRINAVFVSVKVSVMVCPGNQGIRGGVTLRSKSVGLDGPPPAAVSLHGDSCNNRTRALPSNGAIEKRNYAGNNSSKIS